MVGVAQLVELRIVIPAVVGSSPIVHPITQIVGSLAQLVEQLTFNQLVTGSNPVRPTNYLNAKILHYLINSSIAQLVEQMTVNHWVTGSSPVRGAIGV